MTTSPQRDPRAPEAGPRLQGVTEEEFARFSAVVLYARENTYRTSANILDTTLRDAFYDNLYLPRPHCESAIATWCKDEGAVLGVLVGVQGSGKSTITARATNFLPPTYPVLSVNVAVLYPERLQKSPPDTWATTIEETLCDQVRSHFFADRLIDELFPFFLFDTDSHTAPFLLEKQEIECLHAYCRHEGTTQAKTPKAWLAENINKLPALLDVQRRIRQKLTLEHYTKAARSLKPDIHKFVVVLDNVDRVDDTYQPRVFEIAQDLAVTHGTSVNTIITMRKETARSRRDAGGMRHTVITEMGVYGSLESDKGKHTPDSFFGILSKRLQAYEGLSEDRRSATTLVYLSRRLETEYAETYLINLANQSVRDALRYHCTFCRFLLEQYDYDELSSRISKSERSGSFLLSCVYGWLASHANVINKQSLNIVELWRSCRKLGFIGTHGCDLTYLVLVALYNFRRKNDRNPRVRELCALLMGLGNKEVEVCSALVTLWILREKDFGWIISIYQHPIVTSPEQLDMGAEVELNYRGEALIRSASVSFTFINRILFDTVDESLFPAADKNTFTDYYDVENIPALSFYSVRFLFNVALLHSIELMRIARSANRDDWLDDYRRSFCIDGHLQLQRIISANLGYLNGVRDNEGKNFSKGAQEELTRSIRCLRHLEQLYSQQLLTLWPQEPSRARVFDFPRIFGEVSKRKYDEKLPDDFVTRLNLFMDARKLL